MTERALAGLLGGPLKVRLIKLFLFNPERRWSVKEIRDWTKSSPAACRRELKELQAAGLIKRRGVDGFGLHKNFHLVEDLRRLLRFDLERRAVELTRRLRRLGRVKLLIAAGVFLNRDDSRADLLLVGGGFKKLSVKRAVRALETELGRELVYAVLDPKDFSYRLLTRDRFIRDILDYDHRVLVDKLGLRPGAAVV